MRFFPVFRSGTGKNENRKRVPSVGTSSISSSVSSELSQCKVAAQKRARRNGSLASKHRVTSRVLSSRLHRSPTPSDLHDGHADEYCSRSGAPLWPRARVTLGVRGSLALDEEAGDDRAQLDA